VGDAGELDVDAAIELDVGDVGELDMSLVLGEAVALDTTGFVVDGVDGGGEAVCGRASRPRGVRRGRTGTGRCGGGDGVRRRARSRSPRVDGGVPSSGLGAVVEALRKGNTNSLKTTCLDVITRPVLMS
jgi:hypothetical protein